MNDANEKIALMRPLLPGFDAIMPYWQEIDTNRWYSNFGPLSIRFAERMAAFFGKEPGCVVTVSNGTAGLTNILRAMDLPRGSYCLLPSWTFIATPAAVISAGFIPYFLDVDERTWALDPDTVRQHLRELGDKVSSIMVVAPFGAPLDLEAWEKLREETGVRVIIDAAAGFDAFSKVAASIPRKNPVMISLHATKALGIGEGGIVISDDKKLIARVQEMSNFGFCDSRIVSTAGTNGKMSEYHAAVGLAALDGWEQKRAAFHQLKMHYAEALSKAQLSVHAPSLEGEWVSSTLSLRLMDGMANPVIGYLNESGAESRKWWGAGCHTHPAYMIYPRTELAATTALGQSVLALPFAVDMTCEEAEKVVESLVIALQKGEGAIRQQAYA